MSSGVALDSARAFVATHARLLDRRRLGVLIDGGDPAGIVAALEGYRNEDGGYGWGLESDLRSPESQPGAALHAFEAIADAAPRTTHRATELCDWLLTVSLLDGGVPFSLPITDPAGCAPWWVGSDVSESSLQITAVVAEQVHRVAEHDSAVARHPWLGVATAYCLRAIAGLKEKPDALVLYGTVRLLSRLAGSDAAASDLLIGLKRFISEDGIVRVAGGTADEVIRPLDFAPDPATPARDLFDRDVIDRDLDRLATAQQPDGGWPYEPATFSPASALEWRGYVTVEALSVLLRNGRLG
jgi:hypothetical protein